MKKTANVPTTRCAIYTRKSTEEGLEQEFNSLDHQRQSGEDFVASQRAEGWVALQERYDDGGYSGGTTDRPALQRLLRDIEAGKIDCVIVYKVDRFSRSLLDFAKMMDTLEKRKVSLVCVTQLINTAQPMGRLLLNVLLSFAQFEREIISERTRDKIAAARRQGKWGGGRPILGYDVAPGSKLVVNEAEAKRVKAIFDLYLEKQSLVQTASELNKRKWGTKQWTTSAGQSCGGGKFDKCNLLRVLTNVAYLGKVRYKEEIHPGEHQAIIDEKIWRRVQQMLQTNGRSGGALVRNKYGALLKGLLYCKPCQLAMSHSYTTKKGNCAYRYYICGTAQKQGWNACPSKSLPAEEIEQFVVDRIRAIGNDPELLSTTLDQARRQQQQVITSLEAEQHTLGRELKRLNTEIGKAAKGKNSDRLADLQDQLRVTEQRHAEVASELASTESQLVTHEEAQIALKEFEPVWETLSPKEQSRILQLLIKRIDYDGENGTVALTFYPSGLKTLSKDGLSMEDAA